MLRVFIVFGARLVAILLLVLSTQVSGQTLKSEFKPGLVYGIWSNINQLLLDRLASLQIEVPVEVQSGKASGKRVVDLIEQVRLFQKNLVTLRQNSGQIPTKGDSQHHSPTRHDTFDFPSNQLIFKAKSSQHQNQTTQLYLLSSKLLFEAVALTTQLAQTQKVIGPYFATEDDGVKTVDEIYPLIVKANQQLIVYSQSILNSDGQDADENSNRQ